MTRILLVWLLLCVVAPVWGDDLQDLLRLVQEGDVGPVAALVESKPELLNGQDRRGDSPLYQAVYMNRPAIANLLVDKGANVNVTTDRKTVPMHAAAQRSSAEMINLLLGHGAAVDPLEWRGHSPLHFAVLTSVVQGGTGVVPLLLDKGADINRPQGDNQLTALHLAAMSGRAELVALLLDRGAAPNPISRGWTPLGLTQRYQLRDWQKCVELLKAKGGKATPEEVES